MCARSVMAIQCFTVFSCGASFSTSGSPMSSGRSIIRPCIVASSSRPSLLLVRDHLAEELELVAIEALELHRFDRRVVALPGADGDARQQRLGPEALEARGLLHDVF